MLNPHASPSSSLLALIRIVIINKNLIWSLIKREVVGRYRGSIFGLLWSFFNPVLMLVVYTFVFSVVFKAKWIGGSDSKTEFALILFSGLMIFNLFSECINRSPNLILSNVNYVKKVIFPLEVLPIVALGSATFHFLISFFVWIIFYIIFIGIPHIEIFLFPLILLPLVMLILGFSWLLASIGVFLRDVSQIVGVFTTLLMFLTTIFYPITALPEAYQSLMQLNPLTLIIEQARDVLIWGKGINWIEWLIQVVWTTMFAWSGFIWFQKTRRGFADVI